MKKRNPFVVALLGLVTFGIYTIYWCVKTKGELVERGGDIPTAWLLIVPFANLYWLYKYFKGAEKVTSGRVKGLAFFVLLLVLSVISSAVNNVERSSSEGDPDSLARFLIQLGVVLIISSIVAYTQSSYNKVTGGAASPQPAPATTTPQQ